MITEDVKLYDPFKEFPPKCLVELKMLTMSQDIRSKPNWNEKVLKPEIVAKWKQEAVEQGLSSEAVDYVIEEVKFLATLKDETMEPGPVRGTWIADGLMDDGTLSKLKTLIEPLEQIPEEAKDYHPGSDGLVVDLVHPSLYCYVENKSVLINEQTIDERFLPVDETPSKKVLLRYTTVTQPSGKYRWLPSEITCDREGAITIDSYINNLHPTQHKNLYSVLGEILQKFIPMFSQSLTNCTNWKQRVIELSGFDWYGGEDFKPSRDSDEDNSEEYQEWERNRPFLPVPIPKFQQPVTEKLIDLKGEKLQVIFKLANIELTPSKSKYKGGTWHVEGIEEERIVATGIYYYEFDNITESKLSFRQSIEDPDYEQYDKRGLYEYYGLSDEDPMNQNIGSLTAKQGRCIVFPNVYQHRVAPFELIDKTKPGHRKILVFFLVDPTVKIISTHNVLPQQSEWTDVQTEEPANKRYTMTREEAEEVREKLMFERKFARDEYQKEAYERVFSLCEH